MKIEKKQKKFEEKKEKKEAIVRGVSLPISKKVAAGICNLIRNKNPYWGIKQLELVIKKKIAVPMKGELPHRKGKIMSGRYPQKASKIFIKLLNNLIANAEVKGMDSKNLYVSWANANKAPHPIHPGRIGEGRREFKKTHVIIKIKEK